MNANRLVFSTDWSGEVDRIPLVAEYGYLTWSPIIYKLWDAGWVAVYRAFREAHPEVIVIPRIRLDAIGDFGVTEAHHPALYWQHRRFRERVVGNGLAKDDGTVAPALYDWTRSDLPAVLGQYLCDLSGPLRDQRLIDGVTLINAPELEPRKASLLERLIGHIPRDYIDLVGIQVRTRLGVDSAVVLRDEPPRHWSTAWGTVYEKGAWDSQKALAAFTAQAAVHGQSVLDDTLHDLNVLWPRALTFCRPRSTPSLDLGSHTIRYMGGAIAVRSNLNGRAQMYWPDGEGDR